MNEQEIFAAALEQDPSRRALYLDGACGADAPLRRRMDDLLARHDQAGAWFEKPAAEILATAPIPGGDLAGDLIGVQIGPYKIREVLGEGGMGCVFVAEQEKPVRRKVALKVIKPGMDSRQVIARFEAERQALALMDHPHIAKVFDGGVTQAGRPYFVMEMVKGAPITEHCDAHQSPLPERLELFLQVCQAVQHAHQKGIIHRDLKPSNVIVAMHDTKPAVKVIDFGVAKAIGQQLTEGTLYTGVSQLVGTPLYMSPEQAGQSSLDIDTRSDVYSLGVMLYELLTGDTPLSKDELQQSSLDEIRRLIREVDPPRPSVRVGTAPAAALSTISEKRQVEPRQLTRKLRGELDWIVMKALEKDRTRRYESASSLAADVQRYLNDEPVVACPPSVVYRLRKFARRNKARVAAGAFAAAALVLVVGVLGWSVRDRAARQAETAATIRAAIEESERYYRDGKIPEALATARKANELLAERPVEAPLTTRVEERVRDFQMLANLEEANRNTNALSHDPSSRCQQLFAEYGIDIANLPAEESAARIRGRFVAIDLAAEIEYWALASMISATPNVSFRRLSILPLGYQPKVPQGSLTEKLFLVARLADPDPFRRQVRDARDKGDAEALEELARSAPVDKLPLASLKTLAITLHFRLPEDQPVREFLRRAQLRHPQEPLFNVLLAFSYPWTGSAEELRESIGYLHVLSALRPNDHKPPYWIATAYFEHGRREEALPFVNEALRRDPRDRFSHQLRVRLLIESGKYSEAVAEARKLFESHASNRAINHLNLAAALRANGQLDEAIAEFEKLIALEPTKAIWYAHFGRALMEAGRLDEAIAACEKALSLDPTGRVTNVNAHTNWGCILLQKQQYEEAIPHFRQVLELAPDDARYLHNLGVALAGTGRHDEEAIEILRKAIQLNPNFGKMYFNLGILLLQTGNLDEAALAFRQAAEHEPHDDEPLWWVAKVLWEQGKSAEALATYRKAIESEHPRSPRGYGNAATFLANAPLEVRDAQRAVAWAEKAVEMAPTEATYRNSLGIAHYRAGNDAAAIKTLNKSIELNSGGDAFEFYFLAMAHWRTGNKDQARAWYDKGVTWERNNKPPAGFGRLNLRDYRAEAAELLGIDPQPPAPE